ncbi:hypothetical protein T11_11703 [Trichinella zimbabwensis]|uniref:Uncharacterized protein n=1 Tax=Trichinella zimbabwensis TaxID=268475 RepID=A0A0V1H3D0_9BILA|nr:hypothetical protein T11_11703 [Trichinella zimbabwensis]
MKTEMGGYVDQHGSILSVYQKPHQEKPEQRTNPHLVDSRQDNLCPGTWSTCRSTDADSEVDKTLWRFKKFESLGMPIDPLTGPEAS